MAATMEERKAAEKAKLMQEREYTVLIQGKTRAEALIREDAWLPSNQLKSSDLVGRTIDIESRGLCRVVDYKSNYRGKKKVYTLEPGDHAGHGRHGGKQQGSSFPSKTA